MSTTEKWPSVSGHEVPTRNWGLFVVNRTLQIYTRGDNDVQDLTRQLNGLLTDIQMVNGTGTIFVQGSTAALTTLEYEPDVVADVKEAFQRLAPTGQNYRHEAGWRNGSGSSHVRAALLGPSLVIPFVEGKFTLGTWQQVVLVDFDNRPRQREIVVQFMGC